ncbi:MAG: SigB/SigF/SigG family RNA polymerase sigma factor [Clostridiales bacterium]|nr:MAG: SigB/SigF/SigG family RNA polymerase sigma factor [Clostridiales bacterium]
MFDVEKTSDLIQKSKDGDKDALDALIVENTPLVKSVVRRYSGKNVEYDDLMQLGSMGLLKAIKNFDENFNVRFSTYAVPMIAGEIKRFIRDDGAVKVSRALKLLAYNIGKFKDDFSKTNNREPTIDEISKEFNVDKEEVVFALDSTRYPLSLNDTQGDDEGAPLIEKIGENTSNDLDDKIILKGVIKDLPEREKKIIILRYYRDKTQSEVAGIMGVSQVQISRIEKPKFFQKSKNHSIISNIFLCILSKTVTLIDMDKCYLSCREDTESKTLKKTKLRTDENVENPQKES